jgi:hypothetical protein
MQPISLSPVKTVKIEMFVCRYFVAQSIRFFALQILLFQAASLRSQYMTSDHRVAGSSPAGCISSTRADLPAILKPQNGGDKSVTCQSFATF